MTEILRSRKAVIAALEVCVLVAILLVHAVLGMPELFRGVLLIAGFCSGLLLVYAMRHRIASLRQDRVTSGSRFIEWYLVLRVVSTLAILPAFLVFTSSPSVGALLLGFAVAVSAMMWGWLYISTPFFADDEEISRGISITGNAALVAGGAVIGLYVVFVGLYVVIEYMVGPLIRNFG